MTTLTKAQLKALNRMRMAYEKGREYEQNRAIAILKANGLVYAIECLMEIWMDDKERIAG